MEFTHVYVVGDTNDADYISSMTKLSSQEEIDLIKRISLAILKKTEEKEGMHYYNWSCSEYCHYRAEDPTVLYKDLLSEDDIEWFNDAFLPWGNGGVHSIESITLLTIEHHEDMVGYGGV